VNLKRLKENFIEKIALNESQIIGNDFGKEIALRISLRRRAIRSFSFSTEFDSHATRPMNPYLKLRAPGTLSSLEILIDRKSSSPVRFESLEVEENRISELSGPISALGKLMKFILPSPSLSTTHSALLDWHPVFNNHLSMA
jgi:hypothetical protein